MQAVTLEAMPIALLLDGQKNPPSFKTDQTSEFIGYPRGGTVRNFRLMRKLSDEMVLIYRGSNCQLSDEEFESLAHREADPYRRPDAYRNINRETLHQ